MGLSVFQMLEPLQNSKAAAPQGSRNQAPHAVPGYEATSQQTVLHMLLQLQMLFREKVLGRVGVLQAIEVLGFCTQEIRHLSLPLVSLSDKRFVELFCFLWSTNSRTRVSSFCLV